MNGGGIRYQYARLNIAEKLIAINVLVFIVMGLATALIGPNIENWFALPKDFFDFLSTTLVHRHLFLSTRRFLSYSLQHVHSLRRRAHYAQSIRW